MQYPIARFNILILDKVYVFTKLVLIITIFGIIFTIQTGSYFFNLVYAQNVVTIDLQASYGDSYDIVGIYGHGTGLQGLKIGSGSNHGTISDDRIYINFPLKSPDPNNPNKVSVSGVTLMLDVNSIEDRDNGVKVYDAKPSSSIFNSILDRIVDQAVLAQKGQQASLFLNLK